MTKTFYQKQYIDEIIVDSYNKQSELIINQTEGYEFNESEECVIEMRFYDGLAIATDNSGIVMFYPTISEIKKDRQRKNEITEYTGRDYICQFEVALKYGVLNRYKMVADYNLWIKQCDNDKIDIWAIHDTKGNFLFDVSENDYIQMDDENLVEDGHLVKELDDQQLSELRMRYGILWTEKIKDGIVNNK